MRDDDDTEPETSSDASDPSSGMVTAPSSEEETVPAAAADALARDDTPWMSSPGPRAGASGDPAAEGGDPVRIGRFLVIRRIGAGGMGVVYAAYDETLDRKLAVKLLRPDHVGGSGATSGRARLLREAQALARLSHPNVVHVYEVGTFEDQVFVAMEFIAGETLKQWQNRPDREWREVVEVYQAAGKGLAAAHAAGIVHRDFKPDNVLVGDDGSVHVLDFGLAREAGRSSDDGGSDGAKRVSASTSQKALATPLTQTGALMGTPAYMAPEQFHGRTTDARTDQFAFCISLYEGVYGERPFTGKSMAELAHDVVTGAVNPPPQYTRVPPWLRKALLRGLTVRPEDRYLNLDELLSHLSAGLRRRSIGLASGVVAIALGLVAALILFVNDPGTLVDEAERSALAAEFADARARGEQVQKANTRGSNVAEQRNRLVLAWAREHVEADPTLGLAALTNLDPADSSWSASARMLAMAALERGVAWRTRVTRPGTQVVLAPDNDRAAMVEAGALIEVSLAAGTRRVVGEGVRVRPLAYAPDGGRIAGVTTDGHLAVWNQEAVIGPTCATGRIVWSASTGELFAICSGEELVRWRPGETESRQEVSGGRDLFVWPDGESIAVLHADGTLRLRNAEGTDVRELGPADPLGSLHAAPDGDGLLALGRPARRVSFASLASEPAPAFDGVSAAASPLGVGAALTVEVDGSVALRDARAEIERTLMHGPGRVEHVGLSDDAKLAVTVDQRGGARFWRLTEQPPMRLGSHASPVVRLASPAAGPHVAAGTDNGTVHAWNVETRRGRVLGQHPSAIRHLVVSPDGSMVASASREPGVRLWSIARGEPLATVGAAAREGPSALAWSPQGHRLAVGVCEDDGSCPVLVHDLESATTQAWGSRARAATSLVFAPDGSRLVALHPGDGVDSPTVGTVWTLTDGSGRELEIAPTGLPITSVFVDEPAALRVAFVRADRSRLEVVRFDLDGGPGKTIFVEEGLLSVVADSVHPVVVLQDGEGILTSWNVRDDTMRVVGQRAQTLEIVVVSPAGDRVLLGGANGPARIVELDSGDWRTLLEVPQVAAWGAQLVGALPDGTLRIWPELTPTGGAEFVAWARGLTDATVDLQDMR